MIMIDLASYFRYVESPQNEFVKKVKIHIDGGSKASKLRKETGQALIEGIHLMDSWVKAHQIQQITSILTTVKNLENPEIQHLLELCILACESMDRAFPEMILVDDSLASSLTSLVNGPLLVCTIKIPQSEYALSDRVDTLILDAVQDSGNVGTMLRTAAGAGFRRVICTTGTAGVWSLKVLRASMGAHLFLEILESVSVQDILDHTPNQLLVTHLQDPTTDLYLLGERLYKPVSWVMGNEGQGVQAQFLDQAFSVRIPQAEGIESLNVSSACAICLFETVRARKYT